MLISFGTAANDYSTVDNQPIASHATDCTSALNQHDIIDVDRIPTVNRNIVDQDVIVSHVRDFFNIGTVNFVLP